MTIQQLKSQIESKTIADNLLILKYSDTPFIAEQYAHRIAYDKKLSISLINDINDLISSGDDMFNDEIPNNLKLYKCESFGVISETLSDLKNVVIITSKFENDEVENFYINTVTIPKLVDWQIKDYAYSMLEGIEQKYIDMLIDLCHGNIFRLQLEIEKLSIFPSGSRKYVFAEFMDNDQLSDLTTYNVFNLTNAIMSKDAVAVTKVYSKLANIDVNPMGVLSILYNNIRNLISAQIGINPTPENTGMSEKQLYAMKKQPKIFNKYQLINLFKIVSDVDRQVKSGEISTDMILDYLMIKVMSV